MLRSNIHSVASQRQRPIKSLKGRSAVNKKREHFSREIVELLSYYRAIAARADDVTPDLRSGKKSGAVRVNSAVVRRCKGNTCQR
jgi:hypothetical protein